MEKAQTLKPMSYILIVIGFIILLATTIWFVSDLKKKLKQEQDDFYNANHLEQNQMEKHQTEANALFTEKLNFNLSPLELTESFIKDYEKWQSYAWQQSEKKTKESDWNIGKSYDNLIRKYCGDNKKYQGLSFGNNTEKWEDCKVLENTINQNIALVKVAYTNPEFSFLQSMYAYHFKKADRWLLEEKYFVEDNQEQLPYL